MLKRILYVVMLVPITIVSNSQSNTNQQLIDSSIKNAGIFINKTPIKHIYLDLRDTTFYRETLSRFSSFILDSKILRNLILNSFKPDTTEWKDIELPYSIIVVNNNNELIYLSDIKRKFNLKTKEQLRHYRKILNRFNASTFNREISYLSRPVFDLSKKFAIIAFDNISGFLGGGGVTLFHYEDDKWKEIGLLDLWKH